MNIVDKRIDGGKAFDWGKTSADYAKFRDIYPLEFYEKIVARNFCVAGQNVLDIGTGTGVLPRNMYRYGAKWTGTDISEKQIEQAEFLSEGMNIDYIPISAENINFSDNSFDVITACQCFWYFDHDKIMPNLHRILKKTDAFWYCIWHGCLMMTRLPVKAKSLCLNITLIGAAQEKIFILFLFLTVITAALSSFITRNFRLMCGLRVKRGTAE